ncbi:hypothetical protein [Curtobacterium sp. NPDC092190]|uniref:hypothetical protein n=1 Tax=Curtobacterium sp. NPDC092190 TaxID=3363973 RepID=UPI003808A867
MCDWSIDWGDAPGWVGAIGTVLALLWAVFLYSRSLSDQRRSQARLLAPIGGTAPVQVLPGELQKNPSVAMPGLVEFDPNAGLRFVRAADSARVRLVSTSEEAFSNLVVHLVLADGRRIPFALGFDEMGPNEDRQFTVYYPEGTISGPMKVNLVFQDANGRWWERTNGEPVRSIRGRRTQPALTLDEEPAGAGRWVKSDRNRR